MGLPFQFSLFLLLRRSLCDGPFGPTRCICYPRIYNLLANMQQFRFILVRSAILNRGNGTSEQRFPLSLFPLGGTAEKKEGLASRRACPPTNHHDAGKSSGFTPACLIRARTATDNAERPGACNCSHPYKNLNGQLEPHKLPRELPVSPASRTLHEQLPGASGHSYAAHPIQARPT